MIAMIRSAGFGICMMTALVVVVAVSPASAWTATGTQVQTTVVTAGEVDASLLVTVADADELEGPSSSERRDEMGPLGRDDDGLRDLDGSSYEGSDIDADMARMQREARRNRAYMGDGERAPRGRGRDFIY